MVRVSASEFAKNFGRYREAAQREPVAVTNHDRVTGVLVSPDDFDEYQRLKTMATRAAFVEDLSSDTLQAIAAARMDPRHDDLDRLLKD